MGDTTCKVSMLSFNNEEMTNDQTCGRETSFTTYGGRRKQKSRDTVANIKARLGKMELAMMNTWDGIDLIKQSTKRGLEGLRNEIEDLREGMLAS